MQQPALENRPERRAEPRPETRAPRNEAPESKPRETPEPGFYSAGPAIPLLTLLPALESAETGTAPESDAPAAPSEAKAEAKEGEAAKAKKSEATPGKAGAQGKGKEEAGEAEQKASDADGKKRLDGLLTKVKKTARKQQGPAARRSRASKAAKKAADAGSAAAPSPENEAMAMGKGNQIGGMHQIATDPNGIGKIERPTFLELVKKKLREMKMPTNPNQMAAFREQGGAASLKGKITGEVDRQKQGAMGKIHVATAADPTAAAPRKVADAPVQDKGPRARAIGAEDALPPPKSDAEVSLDKDRGEMEDTLSRERLSKQRLAKANDPRFSAVQDGREELHSHAEEAPARYREEETAYLAEQKTEVRTDDGQGRAAMRRTRRGAGKTIHGRQNQQMTDEQKVRQKVVQDLDAIHAHTQSRVDNKLKWLDGEVDSLFTKGEKAARAEFETFVHDEFRSWKSRRYSGVRGKWRWFRDRWRDINKFDAVKKIYVAGQKLYYEKLDKTIESIGTTVDTTLKWCQGEIKKGDEKVRTYFKNLDTGVRKSVADVFEETLDKFADLKSRVEDHRDALADKLVQRYEESRQKLDARIEEIKQANRSLYIRVKRKIVAVLEAINNFRKRLASILARVAGVIELILDDPIGFLKNLLRAVKQGFNQFSDRIWVHLKKGIFGWLFGSLATAGVTLPSDFSAKSIAGLIFQVLGITLDRLRGKAVKLIGARNVEAIEKAGGYLQTLFVEGPAGLWKEIKDDLGNLKDVVIESIKEWVVTKIITAAVTKLVSMFNPAGAIIQAALTIYNVVMFFVERIGQILQLVDSVIDSLGNVVRGRIDAAANYIENTMGLMIPLIIAFLARLVGLGGIAARIKKIIKKVQRRVDKAVDKMLRKIAKRFKNAAAKAKQGIKRLFEWWKIRRKFKQGKDSHTLFFEGGQHDAELMMASKKMPLLDYIRNKLKDAGPEDKKTLRKIAGYAARVANAKTKVRRGKVEPAYMGQKRGEQIRDLLINIANLMSTLKAGGGTNARPMTKVTWKTRNHNLIGGSSSVDGRAMFASPLSIDPGSLAGSEPHQESPHWNKIKKRKGKYVRGHLLNHHVHGPGQARNLTTIPGPDNTRMEQSYERKVKNAVLKENKVLSYSVVASYAGHSKRSNLPDEKSVATSLHLAAHVLELKSDATSDASIAKDGKNWRRSETLFDENMAINLPADEQLDGAKPIVERLDLNSPIGTGPDPANPISHKVARDLAIDHLTTVKSIGAKRAALLLDGDDKTEATLKEVKQQTKTGPRRFVTTEMVEDMKKKNIRLGGGTIIKMP